MGSQVVWVVFFALLSETVHGGPAEPSVGEIVTEIFLRARYSFQQMVALMET